MPGRWSESVIRGVVGGGRGRRTHTSTTLRAGEWCRLHQIWWVLHRQRSSLCWNKLPVLSRTLSSPFLCLGRPRAVPPPKWVRAAIVWRGIQANCRSNSLLARLTLLIAPRKGEEARDGVRPWGEKVVEAKYCETCPHRVLRHMSLYAHQYPGL